MGRADRESPDDDAAGRPADGRQAMRVDRWLWWVRLYRSRALAAAAVGGGRVRVNGVRAKASRGLKIGDVLVLSLQGRDVELAVRSLPARRGPVPEAQACYEQSPASIARGAQWQAAQRLAALCVPRPARRPDKKQRRALLDLARRQGRA
jgi:ribosome-associated heat shock protein Hsp15